MGNSTPWGEAALSGELEKLSRAVKGERNQTLNRCAFKVAQLVAAGHVDEVDARARLHQTAKALGTDRSFTEAQIRRTIESGLDGGRAKPRAGTPDPVPSGAPFDPGDGRGPILQPGQAPPADNPTSTPGEGEAPPSFDDVYLRIDELDRLPQPAPLIDGVLDDHMLFSIVGKGDSFKSFLAFAWLASLATGHPWLGREVSRRKVLYVVGEGAYGLAQRRDAWQGAWQTTIDPEWFHVRRVPLNLFKPGASYLDLYARIERERYGVIMFDTLQRMTPGADHNQAKDAGLVIERLGELRSITDGSVGIVAHTGKHVEFGTRGSSAWEDDLDLVWKVRRDEDNGEITARLDKRRDGPEGEEIKLAAHPVAGTKSLILRIATKLDGADPLPKHALKILELLGHSSAPERGLTATPIETSLKITSRDALYTALDRLQAEDWVQKRPARYPTYAITEKGRHQLREIIS